MKYSVQLSTTFVRQFKKLETTDQKRIREALKKISDDPVTKRAGADIKRLQKTKPVKHRIRVGQYRIIYYISDTEIRVIEVFARSGGYRE